MALSLTEKSKLVSSFWKDRPSPCPRHEIPMRTFFVERVYKPQVVMVCPKGETFRFDQKPKQIEFSRPHLKTMALDAQESEFPACPQDFTPLVVYRTPAVTASSAPAHLAPRGSAAWASEAAHHRSTWGL